MTINYTPKDAVLDVIGVALVLAPEPLTTPVGISILCRKRGGAQAHESQHALHMYPDYVYKVDNIRGREITWQARTLLTGQLPLGDTNKPEIKIKARQHLIISSAPAEKSAAQKISENLPPGVKVYHELRRPSRVTVSNQPTFIPGETIHHTVRPLPQAPPVNNKAAGGAYIHHAVENSPGYRRASSSGDNLPAGPSIIHHTIKDSPGVQHGNPANIVKPVRIVQHHELNPTPPIQYRGRIIQPPAAPPSGNKPRFKK